MLYICFFFSDTATTEIYTYGHTLSLHDALPFSHAGCSCKQDDLRNVVVVSLALQDQHHQAFARTQPCGGAMGKKPQDPREGKGRRGHGVVDLVRHAQRDCQKPDSQADQQVRSEEHTSELQSLMRISYAVFCL